MSTLATPQPLVIRKGETFSRVLRWSSRPQQYLTITDVSRTAPCELTVPGHGLVDGWRIERITAVQGMRDINTHLLQGGNWIQTPLGMANENGLKVKVIDADTLQLPTVNAASYAPYQAGGVIEYYAPIDLAGYTARMQVRADPDATDVLLELTTENGRIALDNTLKTINLEIDVAEIDALLFERGVTTLEMVAGSGVVTLLFPNRPVIVGNTNVTR